MRITSHTYIDHQSGNDGGVGNLDTLDSDQ